MKLVGTFNLPELRKILMGKALSEKAKKRIVKRIKKSLFIQKLRSAADWARAKRKMAEGENSEPGKFRPGRTPYLLPVYEAIHEGKYRKYVLIISTQSGKTELGINIIGHAFDEAPRPALYITPKQGLTESISKRIQKMIDSIPSLKDLQTGGKLTEKFIGGIRLGLGWSSSETELSSHPAGIVICDEVDKFEDKCGDSGDPLELAESRCASFPDYLFILYSSPSKGKIKKHYEEGTKLKWNWPCPNCWNYFYPLSKHLKWPENATPAQAEKEAYLECPHCEYHIKDEHKFEMNELGCYLGPGQYVEDGEIKGPEVPENSTVSWWVSGLSSPWENKSFGKLAARLLKAYQSKEEERIKAVITSEFAEEWVEKGDAPELTDIDKCIKPYRMGTIPGGVQCLVAGVDVQKNGLFFVIRGFGYGLESWKIDSGFIEGDTEKFPVWQRLEKTVVHATYINDDKYMFSVGATFIDARYRTGMVYEFCNFHKGMCFPCMGHEKQVAPVRQSRLDHAKDSRGNRISGHFLLYNIHDPYFKAWVYNRIKRDPTYPGCWWIPQDADSFYKKSVLSEERVEKPSGEAVWIVKYRQNHFLDCEKLIGAGSQILRLNKLMEARQKNDRSRIA
jgi:phage terminase large subunit GpA-like protein